MSRAPLSKQRVLAAAVAIADEGGLEALSMRRLAQELGVEAMSLYHYVRNKDELVAGIVDLVMAEIDPPAEGEAWKPALRGIAVSYRKALTRHPWASRVLFSQSDSLPNRMRYMETVLRTLAGAGLSAEVTDLAYHVLESHVVGFTLWAANFRGFGAKMPDLAARFLRTLDPAHFPHMIQHIHHHMSPPPQPRSAFEFGLDLILDGIERLSRETPARRRTTATPVHRRSLELIRAARVDPAGARAAAGDARRDPVADPGDPLPHRRSLQHRSS